MGCVFKGLVTRLLSMMVQLDHGTTPTLYRMVQLVSSIDGNAFANQQFGYNLSTFFLLFRMRKYARTYYITTIMPTILLSIPGAVTPLKPYKQEERENAHKGMHRARTVARYRVYKAV